MTGIELGRVTVYDPEGNKMIRAEEILVNFKLTELLQGRNVNIDGVFVDSAHVFLTKINESDSSRDLNLNVFIANINEHSGGGGGEAEESHRRSILAKPLLIIASSPMLIRIVTASGMDLTISIFH